MKEFLANNLGISKIAQEIIFFLLGVIYFGVSSYVIYLFRKIKDTSSLIEDKFKKEVEERKTWQDQINNYWTKKHKESANLLNQMNQAFKDQVRADNNTIERLIKNEIEIAKKSDKLSKNEIQSLKLELDKAIERTNHYRAKLTSDIEKLENEIDSNKITKEKIIKKMHDIQSWGLEETHSIKGELAKLRLKADELGRLEQKIESNIEQQHKIITIMGKIKIIFEKISQTENDILKVKNDIGLHQKGLDEKFKNQHTFTSKIMKATIGEINETSKEQFSRISEKLQNVENAVKENRHGLKTLNSKMKKKQPASKGGISGYMGRKE